MWLWIDKLWSWVSSFWGLIGWLLVLVPLTCIANTTKKDIQTSINAYIEHSKNTNGKCYKFFKGLYDFIVNYGHFSWSTLLKWIALGIAPFWVSHLIKSGELQAEYKQYMRGFVHLSLFSLVFIDLVYTEVAFNLKFHAKSKNSNKYINYLESPTKYYINHRLILTIVTFIASYLLLIIGALIYMLINSSLVSFIIIIILAGAILWYYYSCYYKKIINSK